MYIPAKMMCMSNPTIASPARKPRMPPALRSCRSNSISSCLSSSLLMSRLQKRRGLRIVDRQQRPVYDRSEEHTSELQSPCNLVCRLLLEKKKVTSYRKPLTILPNSICPRTDHKLPH